MIGLTHHLKAYLFIQKNRMHRKVNTYKLALSVVIDKTTAIYLLIIGLYVIFSFFILNDFMNDYYDDFLFWEKRVKENIWMIVTILLLGYVIQSFKNPGVVFSSSEYQLSLLPYSREKIWLLTAIEKWLKQFINLLMIGLLIIFLTPISPFIIAGYIGLLIFINVIMTIPQWKLFQKNIYTKIATLCVILIINFINFILQTPIVSILLITFVIILNLLLKGNLFHQVRWSRVTEISDFQIWTMWFISKISKVDMKRQRKYSIFQNLSWRKKPFKYQEKSIHHRLWQIYFGKNIQLIFQIMSALFLLVVVFSFVNGLMFHIILAIAIHIYTSILRSFFMGRFASDIVQTLPWNLLGYKQSFFKWAVFGGLILLIPISVFLGINFSAWLPLQLFYFISTFLYLFQIRIDKAITLLGKKYFSHDFAETIGYLLLIGIGFSWKYPYILLTGFIIPFLMRSMQNNKQIYSQS